jgi:myo-inositol-1(or 4)-monophosphatase
MSPNPESGDLALLGDAAREAGALALSMRAQGLKIWSKSEGSPVTDADMATDDLLKTRLLDARPDYGWLSEETADDPARLKKRRLFVVDPIDGTAAFMKGRPWWTVALAVVEDGQPVAAVVFAPQTDEFAEAALGQGARRNGQRIQASDADTLEDASILADAKLLERPIWPEPWPAMRVEKRNSIAYRMTLVAAGAFDAAIALGRKWDWDVCAGTLIATEAGAKVSDHRGRPFEFNRPHPYQASLVCAAPALQPLILSRCAPISLPD